MLPQSKILLGSKTPSSKLINVGGESSEPILPIDLIIEIFSRLPAKSVARFRCVSKLWASILHRPYFSELFLTRSSSRPQVFFAFRNEKEVFFYSIPQPRNRDEILSPIVATYVTKTPFRAGFERFLPLTNIIHINGLVFLRECNMFPVSYDTKLKSRICNPTTGQSLAVPKLSWRTKCYIGYDPIEKQYKLLSITSKSYKVLTLGSRNSLWRDILCSTEHYPLSYGICINSLLYYLALANEPSYGLVSTASMVVCFDIRSEKFHFMNVMENFSRAVQIGVMLINYNGKLGSLSYYINGRSETIEIWVLEDFKKHEWSKHIHVLPPSLWNDVDTFFFSIVGMIGTYEIIMFLWNNENDGFYVVYYNTKKKSVAKIEIQGMKACKASRVCMFLDHVEDLKSLSIN